MCCGVGVGVDFGPCLVYAGGESLKQTCRVFTLDQCYFLLPPKISVKSAALLCSLLKLLRTMAFLTPIYQIQRIFQKQQKITNFGFVALKRQTQCLALSSTFGLCYICSFRLLLQTGALLNKNHIFKEFSLCGCTLMYSAKRAYSG